MNKLVRLCWVFLAVVLLSGCMTLKDPEVSQEYTGDVVARLKPGQTVGQTLVARRGRLKSVQVWLRQVSVPENISSVITARLYRAAGDDQPAATARVRFADLARSFPITIEFPAQEDPPGQSYYLELEVASGEADLFGRLEDAYPSGALYVSGAPVDADAGFRVAYDYGAAALLEDLGRAAGGVWLIIPLGLVLWAPGRLLLWRQLQGSHLDWGMRTALSLGISLSLLPLALLWTGVVGLHWQRATAWIIYAIVAAVLACLLWKGRIALRRPDGLDLALAAVFVFTLALRLIMARDLAAPPWVDPVHHATITHMIAEQGQYPPSYLPYAETRGATYHPGFHATVAAFLWLSGLNVVDGMLLFGQVQNAASVLAVYLLAVTLTRDRLAGVLAALATGAFFPMPAYYLSWGRYTQLAGLIILPTAIYLLHSALKRPQPAKAGLLLPAAIACAGMFLTHYRVTAFLALWLAAFMLAELLRTLDRRAIWVTLPKMAAHFAIAAAGAILLTLPWWPELYTAMLQPAIARAAAAPQPLTLEWAYINPAYGRQVIWLALGGLLLSILRLGWFGPTLALWTGLLFMSANQGVVRAPLAGSINKTSVEISLFLPAAILAGYLVSSVLGWGHTRLPALLRRPYAALLTLGVAALSLLGAARLLPLLNPATIMARQADRPAWEWVAAHIPAGEPLLTNPFLWGYGIYAGQDGGYWLTPAAGRRTMPPISLYGLGPAEQFQEVRSLSQAVLDNGKDAAALHAQMQAHGIRYVFLGRRGGAISPKALRESPLFRVIYAQDGVHIFEISGQKQESTN